MLPAWFVAWRPRQIRHVTDEEKRWDGDDDDDDDDDPSNPSKTASETKRDSLEVSWRDADERMGGRPPGTWGTEAVCPLGMIFN